MIYLWTRNSLHVPNDYCVRILNVCFSFLKKRITDAHKRYNCDRFSIRKKKKPIVNETFNPKVQTQFEWKISEKNLFFQFVLSTSYSTNLNYFFSIFPISIGRRISYVTITPEQRTRNQFTRMICSNTKCIVLYAQNVLKRFRIQSIFDFRILLLNIFIIILPINYSIVQYRLLDYE